LIYDKVNDAVGGNNPNQMLTLLLPGISLAQEDYKYDLDKTKPIVVEANESRLVNKLYDPYELCVADNGKTLQNQYKSALNLLSPKLNAKIAKAKNMMRRFLLTKYPDMDPEKIDTLQEKYFELFQNYLNASEKWAEIQKNKRDELKAFYKLDNPDFTPDQNKEAYANYNNAYLEWYQIYAEAELNIVNKERARILTVFTPNDMNIIEGILDCGSGAELNEARRTLENTRKLNPDGGYTYPVKLVPSNWFENLDTSIPAIDLLQSPTILKDELALAKTRQITLAAKIQALGDSLAKTEESLDSATKNLKTNLDTFNTCHEALASFGEASILNFAKECVSAYMTMDASTLEKQVTKKNESDAGQEPQSSENKTDEQKKDDNKKLYVELYTNAKKIENVDGIKDNTDYKNLINSLKDCVTIQTNGNGSETVSGKISTNPTQELVNNLFSVFTSQCKEINKLQNQAVTATSDLLKSLQSVTANKGEYKMQSDLLTKLQPQYDELCARVNELETEMNLSANIQNASTFTQYEPPKGYA
ncbi:MAG: hypothetical protein HUK20_15730, partial [Fibrobacter sp.]|nr:hypothetical protein [Fibrobacter sp.]